jgi:uncharacterized protein YxeA
MEEYTPEKQEEKSEQLKRWFQDNLRIVISVAIVIIIAGGIYSYSKRTDSPIVAQQAASTDENATDENQADTDEKTVTENQGAAQEVSSTQTSKETEGSFVETAVKGDGLTHLARKATANYLEKNQDSALTKEHKIYIEDYLRKNVGQKGGIRVGTSVEFSKDLIAKAIAQSKTLNERQLKNLQKYSSRVSSL